MVKEKIKNALKKLLPTYSDGNIIRTPTRGERKNNLFVLWVVINKNCFLLRVP